MCVLFRRPDSLIQRYQSDDTTADRPMASVPLLGNGLDGFHQWWPPVSCWHSLDDDSETRFNEKRVNDSTREPSVCLELRTHLELTAGRWSDSGTVELGLGYCLRDVHDGVSTGESIEADASRGKDPIVLPLIDKASLARVKLIPSAPVGHW